MCRRRPCAASEVHGATGSGGRRADRVLARLSPGEYVVNAASTARHAWSWMRSMQIEFPGSRMAAWSAATADSRAHDCSLECRRAANRRHGAGQPRHVDQDHQRTRENIARTLEHQFCSMIAQELRPPAAPRRCAAVKKHGAILKLRLYWSLNPLEMRKPPGGEPGRLFWRIRTCRCLRERPKINISIARWARLPRITGPKRGRKGPAAGPAVDLQRQANPRKKSGFSYSRSHAGRRDFSCTLHSPYSSPVRSVQRQHTRLGSGT